MRRYFSSVLAEGSGFFDTTKPDDRRDDGVDVVRSAAHDCHDDMSGLVDRSPFQFFR
jgi:hypothetical protein